MTFALLCVAVYIVGYVATARIAARDMHPDNNIGSDLGARTAGKALAAGYLFYGPFWPIIWPLEGILWLYEKAPNIFIARQPKRQRKEAQLERARKRTKELEQELEIS